MSRTITVSLPVVDLTAAITFYSALGFVNNPQCSGDGAAFNSRIPMVTSGARFGWTCPQCRLND